MKQLFVVAAIFALVAMVGALFIAADQWRRLLFVLAGICGLVMSLARILVFERTLTMMERVVSILYEAAFWIILIGLFLFFAR
ncbi:hypothetical protein [Roseiflexus sp.]|uniref:hypothetical protein n=1 Tax=Roseiflexus sp. TaxID=2562120 RepID=UPI00398B48FA